MVARQVQLSFTPEAQKDLADNLKFNQDRLLETVKRGLVARNLLNEGDPQATAVIEIRLMEIRVRSNFNAVMWGFMAGADKVRGEVMLRDGSGRELDHFEVHADYALGGLAGGQDGSRMNWLYERFAELTVQSLTGEDQGKSVAKR